MVLRAPNCKFINLNIINYRYHITSFLLIGLMILHIRNGQWVGDFWEHSAAVRELTTNIISPQHSQLLLNTPHALYSPYSLCIAYFTQLAKVDVITSLSIASILNLVIFLVALKLFVSSLFPNYAEEASFYTLVFVLLLWGRERTPWDWSGFFHLRVLGYVLPYPSTFTISLLFIVLSMYIKLLKDGNRLWFAPILGFSIVILISHPLSFIVLSIGLVSICLGKRHLSFIDITALVVLFVITLTVSLLWPYYPIAKLLTGETSIYNSSHIVLYQSVVDRIFPALIGIPFLFFILKSNKRHPLGIMFVILSLVYAFGMYSKLWVYGRVISFIVLILQISLAYGIAKIENRSIGSHSNQALRKTLISILILMLLIPYSYKGLIKPVLKRAKPGIQNTYHQYEFLSEYVDQYDVVLSDLVSSSLVPTFGGKVVAVNHPLPFVNDTQERIEDVRRFFTDTITTYDRLLILEKYGVSYILMSKEVVSSWKEIKHTFPTNNNIIFENEKIVLISINIH